MLHDIVVAAVNTENSASQDNNLFSLRTDNKCLADRWLPIPSVFSCVH